MYTHLPICTAATTYSTAFIVEAKTYSGTAPLWWLTVTICITWLLLLAWRYVYDYILLLDLITAVLFWEHNAFVWSLLFINWVAVIEVYSFATELHCTPQILSLQVILDVYQHQQCSLQQKLPSQRQVHVALSPALAECAHPTHK